MERVIKITIVVIVQLMLLWGWYGVVLSDVGGSFFIGVSGVQYTVLLSVLLLLLNLLPLYENHRKYGLQYVVLLSLLAVNLLPFVVVPLIVVWAIPFFLLPILVANMGYLSLLDEQVLEWKTFPILLCVAYMGGIFFFSINYCVLYIMKTQGIEVQSAGMETYVYVLFCSYFVVSVIQNLLFWYKISWATLFSVLFTLLILSVGFFLACRNPIWMIGGAIGAIVTIWGQYLMIHRLRNNHDTKNPNTSIR